MHVDIKLPGNTRDRWDREVLIIRRQHRKEPELEDLIGFFDNETYLANDPLFSREALRDYNKRADKVGNNRREQSEKNQAMYGENQSEKEKDDAKDGGSEFKKVQCPVCDENHVLDNCSMFKDQTLEERSKTIWKKKLWYGYYSPVSQDPNAKTCKQRRTCMICKQSHPLGLHGYLPKKKQPKVTSDTKDGVPPVDDKKLMTSNIESKIISMCVVPVKISHSKSKEELSTYAMLEN